MRKNSFWFNHQRPNCFSKSAFCSSRIQIKFLWETVNKAEAMDAKKQYDLAEYSETNTATIDALDDRSQVSETYTSDDTSSIAFSDSSIAPRQRFSGNDRRSNRGRSIRKRKKKRKLKKIASVKKGSLAFQNLVKRVSFLGSGIHFEPLKVMEQRALMKKIQKKKIEKEKARLAKIPPSQRVKKKKTLAELYPPPGPATYDISDSRMIGRGLSKYSGIFNKSNPKSYIDWITYFAQQTPAPNAYPRPSSITKGGGRFNESRPNSELDWVIYRAKSLPGPADYKPRPIPLPKGGRISTANVKSEIDWIQYFAKDTPGPNAYARPPLPKQGGGRFNVGNGKSEIEWIMYYNKDTPGPATYGMLPTPKVGGGRFNESRPKSVLDWVEYRAKDLPGPNKYDPKILVDGEYFDARKTAWKRLEESKRSPLNMRKSRKKLRTVSVAERQQLEKTVKYELYS